MIYELVKPDHHLLFTKLERFNFTEPPIHPVELANNLIETMVHNKGIGLSANQVGLPYRVFVLHSVEPLALFNPSIVDSTTEEVKLDEGCLTYPNLFLPIKRPSVIKVRYQDAFGEFHTEKFIGMTARCVQHELDHLNGIDYTKRANAIHLTRALNQKKILDRKVKKLKQIGRAI
jgi:peptide deformylase